MIRAADSIGRRASMAGFGLRPTALYSILTIFAVWLIIELLLAARFWIQLTAADANAGAHRLVLSLSRPLVAPFQEVQAVTERTSGTFEYGTVVAAEAYLILAILLVIAVFCVSNIVAVGKTLAPRSTPRGRIGLAEDQTGPLASKAARLRNTFYLSLSADAAQDALRNLRLDRFSLEFVAIPAEGGCVVAVFSPVDDETARLPIFSRIRESREEHNVARLLKSIGDSVVLPAPQPGR